MELIDLILMIAVIAIPVAICLLIVVTISFAIQEFAHKKFNRES